MEPAVELAVRITAHLWLLRDVFPWARNVSEIENSAASWAPLHEAAEKDCALASRIMDLVNPPADVSGRDSFDGVDRDVGRVLAESVNGSAWQLWRRNWRETADRDALLKDAIERFLIHIRGAAFHLARPGHYPPYELLRFRADRGMDSLCRDSVVEEIANWLLANRQHMESFAKTLDYLPEMANCAPNRWHDPARLLEAADTQEEPVPIPFSMVQREELDHIECSRFSRLGLLAQSVLLERTDLLWNGKLSLPNRDANTVPSQQASQMGLFGIALSGGGIRSATFALGVLQALADRHILSFADYLSTVSGGGYIGSWLLAWTKRRGSILSVEKSLQGYSSDLHCNSGCDGRGERIPAVSRNSDPMSDDVRPVRYLRSYSRYLAPDAGFFSADTWTIMSTWLRNVLLNLFVILPFLAAALLLPRLAVFALVHLPASEPGLTAAAAGCLWAACWLIMRNLRILDQVRGPKASSRSGDPEGLVASSIVPLILLGAFFSIAGLWFPGGPMDARRLYITAAIYLAGICILGASPIPRKFSWRQTATAFLPRRETLAALLLSVPAGCGLVYLFSHFFLEKLARDSQHGVWIVITTGFALVAGIVSAVVIIFIGVMGTSISEPVREWWSRLGAWLAIAVSVWLVFSAISFFAPLWIAEAGIAIAGVGGAAWLAITTAGVKLAFSPKSGKNGDSSLGTFLSVILNLAPYIFVLGLLGTISFAVYWLSGRLLAWPSAARFFGIDGNAHGLCCADSAVSFARLVNHYWSLMYPASPHWLALLLVFVILFMIFASRIDINEFSMQNFYKNRLVRAYLGASRIRQHRWPNAFTTFDPDDDIPLSRLTKDDKTRNADANSDCWSGFNGPFPIINTALNITRGEDEARQERKAASFFFTPLRSGFDFTRKQTGDPASALFEYAFRPTSQYAGAASPGGISLGTAIATSGAAANPNSGFHTSPGLAFLLTVFNVRLGRWIGNPRNKHTWRESSPRLGLSSLLSELFGQTRTDSRFVQLSDGGHFDNMGLYELVRRRCKYIIVCDGEEDAAFKLEGIGGAIRKCRVDFGVVIRLDIRRLRPTGKAKRSKAHYAVGTILYPGDKDCGTLVYIKTSLTGDEPVDVKEFCKRVPEFPNESTANQFFDESHFESYRALGQHIGQGIFKRDAAALFRHTRYDLAQTLAEIFRLVCETAAKEPAG